MQQLAALTTGEHISGRPEQQSSIMKRIYTVFSRRMSEDVDPVGVVAVQQFAGLVWALAVLIADTPFGSVEDILTTPGDLLAASAVSGLLYCAAYWLYIAALRSVPAAVAGSYFNVIPIIGIALAYVFLGETLEPIQWLGASGILVSAYMLVLLTNSMGAERSAE